MSKFKGTYIFAAVVVAFVAYAYFVEFKKPQTEEAQKAEQSKLFQVSKDQISAVSLQSKKEKISLEKASDQTWNLKSPVNDLADSDVVGSLIETLTTEKSESVVAEGQQVDYGVYGLVDPLGTITFRTPSGFKSVAIGSEQALGGKRYARIFEGKEEKSLQAQDKVYLVGFSLESQINKNSKDFQSHQVYRGIQKDVSHIVISQKGNQSRGITELEKKNGKWMLVRPVSLAAMESAVDGFLINLAQLKATDIAAQKKDSSELKRLGLLSPQQSVLIENSQGQKWLIELSTAQNSNVNFVTSDRPFVYQFTEASAKTLLKESDDFRDRMAPFNVDIDAVAQMVVKSGEASFQLLKKNKDWVIEPEDKSKIVDQAQVKTLLERFKTLQVKHFLGLSEGVKLDPVKGEILFKDQSGKSLIDVRWGDNASDLNSVLVRTSLTPELLSVEKVALQMLPFLGVVRSMATPAPTEPQKTSPGK